MDVNIVRQIERIEDRNQRTLVDARLLNLAVNSVTDIDVKYDNPLPALEMSSKVLRKISNDARVSLNKIYRYSLYDNFENSEKVFFKNSKYVSDDIPDIIKENEVIAFEVVFRNTGIFYSWTSEKGISLRVNITRDDGSSYDPEFVVLDVNIPGNEPGDEEINGDYLKEKKFIIDFLVDFPAGNYTFELLLEDVSSDDYNSSRIKPVVVIP